MSTNIKQLRGQLRQLVQELLETELVKAVEDRLMKHVNARLDTIDKRQKDIAGFMVRQASLPQAKITQSESLAQEQLGQSQDTQKYANRQSVQGNQD